MSFRVVFERRVLVLCFSVVVFFCCVFSVVCSVLCPKVMFSRVCL